MGTRENLYGNKYNRLTVISEQPIIREKKTYWLCKCDCGNETTTRADQLKSGHTTSCGCQKKESVSAALIKRNTKDGLRFHPMYNMWAKMKDRCCNEKNKSFKDYGGRGIVVCERWRDSFKSFIADMGERPTIKHEIDRIDNDGNYQPGNCRWVLRLENARNKSTNKLNCTDVSAIKKALIAGEKQTDLARQFGVTKYAIHDVSRNRSWKDIK